MEATDEAQPPDDIAFGCLPPTTQGDVLPGLLFDLTDDPADGETVLRLTNGGSSSIAFQVGDVGIAMMESNPDAATDLDPESALDGIEVVLEPGETQRFDVAISVETEPCAERQEATRFSPIFAAAVDGVPLPHPLVGALYRP